jgi:hypothetical protein
VSATLLIVIPQMDVNLAELRVHLETNFVVSGDPNSLTVGQPDTVEKVFVVQVLDFISDGVYEDWPDERIPRTASVFSFDYVSVPLMLSIAHALAAHFDAIVDTNFGAVIPLGELSSRHLPENLA